MLLNTVDLKNAYGTPTTTSFTEKANTIPIQSEVIIETDISSKIKNIAERLTVLERRQEGMIISFYKKHTDIYRHGYFDFSSSRENNCHCYFRD